MLQRLATMRTASAVASASKPSAVSALQTRAAVRTYYSVQARLPTRPSAALVTSSATPSLPRPSSLLALSSPCLPTAPRRFSSDYPQHASSSSGSSMEYASRSAQEARIKELRAELKKEKEKKGLNSTKMLYAGAGVFAFSEFLSGLIGVACIMTWIGYCVDWNDLLKTKDRAIEGFSRDWNKTSAYAATTASNSTHTASNSTAALPKA